jgi:transcriptional regulator with XRE-family HTH domain
MIGMTDLRHGELGSFLKSRRDKLAPKTVGLLPGRRRRTAGLRREEVAELAGIGVDWYVRLEQGRAVTPSAATIDALARALRLTKAEHNHLRALAQPSERKVFEPEQVPETVVRVVESLNQPAYVTGRRWDILVWNDAAAKIFAFDRLAEADRNILVCMMTRPQTRRLFGAAWESEAKRMVAQFRTTAGLYAGDPAFAQLLERLQSESAEFTSWWTSHDIRSTVAGQKALSHPTKGKMRLEYASFQANDDPGLKLVIYTSAVDGPPRKPVASK